MATITDTEMTNIKIRLEMFSNFIKAKDHYISYISLTKYLPFILGTFCAVGINYKNITVIISKFNSYMKIVN